MVRCRGRNRTVGSHERWATWLSATFVISVLVAGAATPLDPFTQVLALLVVLPLVGLAAYIVVIRGAFRLSPGHAT